MTDPVRDSQQGADYEHVVGKAERNPLDSGICPRYVGRSHHAQMRTAMSHRDAWKALADAEKECVRERISTAKG